MSEDLLEKGRAIRRAGFGPSGEDRWERMNAMDPGYARSILEYCYGTVWARPHLEMKLKELIVIAVTATQNCPEELGIHVQGAMNRGATREEIIETIVLCAPYIGYPRTNHALKAATEVFEQWEKRKDWHA